MLLNAADEVGKFINENFYLKFFSENEIKKNIGSLVR